MKKIIFIYTLICIPSVLRADGILNRLIRTSGGMSNVTKPMVIHDQSSGYISGGSIQVRAARPKTIQPVYFEPPSFSMDGCGSKDFRFGGFTFIKLAGYLNFFKKIPSAALPYALRLGIKAYCPQCENVTSDLEKVSNTINSMTMNDCEMAQKLVDGTLAKLNANSVQSCMSSNRISDGGFEDMQQLRSKCSKAPDSTKGSEGKQEREDTTLGDEFNIAWKAMTKGGEKGKKIEGDKSLLEFMMSISGTLIGKKEGKDADAKWRFEMKSSLFTDMKQLDNYISGSEPIKLYKCNDSKECLSPEVMVKQFNEKEAPSFVDKIRSTLEGLAAKVIANETKFTAQEEELISLSTIPVIPMIENAIMTRGGGSDGYGLVRYNSEILESLAYDILVEYMTSLLDKVRNEVYALEVSSNDKAILQDYMHSLSETRRIIESHKYTAFQRAQISMQSREHITLERKQIISRVSRIFTNKEE